jgi:hypothetical protein
MQNSISNQLVQFTIFPSKETSFKKSLSASSVAYWLWCLFVLLFGMKMLSLKLWFSGAVLLLSFLISIPTLRIKFSLNNKRPFEIPKAIFLICSFLLFCSGFYLSASTEEKEANALAVETQQSAQKKKADFEQSSATNFISSKPQILAKAREKFEGGDLSAASTLLAPFKHLSDPDLVRLRESIEALKIRKELTAVLTAKEQSVRLQRLVKIDPMDVASANALIALKPKFDAELAAEREEQLRLESLEKTRQILQELPKDRERFQKLMREINHK